MDYSILGFALVFSICDWFAIERNWRTLDYLFKPSVMIIWIIWLVQNGSMSSWMIWFVIGAFFSLIGDILLMLPKNLFIQGLVSFFLAHVSYIIGINKSIPPISSIVVIIVFVIAIITWRLYLKISHGMDEKGIRNLKIPVLFYAIVISIMMLSAMLTLFREDWSVHSAVLISAGAILFFISDSIIAWELFVSPIPHGGLKTMITYFLAQAGILIGAAIHFLG